MELFDLNIHFPVTDPTWIFFLVLIIILFAPMILGRLRIPHIIGMIPVSYTHLDVYKRQRKGSSSFICSML